MCHKDYLARERVQELYGLEVPDESVAIAALLLPRPLHTMEER